MSRVFHSTQVCIIGSGPSGLLLSQLLHNAGIDSIVLERQTREHVESRVRAGVLEQGTVKALHQAGIGDYVAAEGIPHKGFNLCFDGDEFRIDLAKHTGKTVTVYGQTEVTQRLIQHRVDQNAKLFYGCNDVRPLYVTSDTPVVEFENEGQKHRIKCEYIAGCDGFHGVSRGVIPSDVLNEYERVYPFGWLGILCDSPPIADELIYANHQRGFALCSMRSPTRSRFYIQCSENDAVENWSDEQFYDELCLRLGDNAAGTLTRGQSFEKSIAPLRSYVAEPMRYGNLFLAGDAAHIVPPTGAKGLNLAVSDVRTLSKALDRHYNDKDSYFIDTYSETCLKRVWKIERFSWYMSSLLHQFPDHSPFEKKMQRAEFDYICSSEAAAKTIAENYVGLSLNL